MKRKVLPFSVRNRILFLIDMLIIIAAHFLVLMLVADYNELPYRFMLILRLVGAACITFAVVLNVGRNYKIFWAYAGAKDYLRMALSLALASFITLTVDYLIRKNDLYLAVRYRFILCFAAMFVSSAGILMVRMLIRGLNRLNKEYHSVASTMVRTLIVGAGEGATMLIKEIKNNEKLENNIIGLVDDDFQKRNLIIRGARVLGTVQDIPKLAEKHDIEEIIIAIPSLEAERNKQILAVCAETNCEVKICTGLESMKEGEFNKSKLRSVQIEDLLGRDPIELDNDEIKGYIKDRVIFVTGGGGSIGSELCRQIMKYDPQKLVIIDIYENNAYDLQMELNRLYPENQPDVIIASVRDMDRLDSLFDKYRPYIVFHAAAHKHVPLMETSPGEAIKNNVFGTYNTAKCADKYGVCRFVMISTDKAVNPTNVMGATKRICEMIVQCMQQVSKTEFVAVRFGNVLGSNGSVIPLFKKQIAEGGPLTVTHKDITRFFMTIPEAAHLVLQAASYANGGEIFVLDMGQPVRIYDLAVNLIKLSGLRPGIDIDIEVTGLRPGEKLYEELLMNEEGLKDTKHKKIFIGQPIPGTMEKLEADLALLSEAVEKKDNEYIRSVVAQVVPTYVKPETQKVTVAS